MKKNVFLPRIIFITGQKIIYRATSIKIFAKIITTIFKL